YKSALRVSFILLGNRIGAFTNLSFAGINGSMINDKIKPSVGLRLSLLLNYVARMVCLNHSDYKIVFVASMKTLVAEVIGKLSD
ncbi:hypothetical protein Tco_0503861, partial [Tanacetum coccineum]